MSQDSKTTTVNDVVKFTFTTFKEDEGLLVPITGGENLVFPIERIFYAYNVPLGVIRGKHAHHDCDQILIALKRELDVFIKDGKDEIQVGLVSPNQAVFIPAGLWCEEQYTDETIMLAICSHKYAKADYINDWEEFIEWKRS